jgi:transcriptional regulator with XRE-family HTH domain
MESIFKYNLTYYIAYRGKSRDGEKAIREEIRKVCNHLTPAQLSRWENYKQEDTSMIPADHLLAISKVLNVDINLLFNKAPEPVPNPL